MNPHKRAPRIPRRRPAGTPLCIADILALPIARREELLLGFTPRQWEVLIYDWRLWARRDQLPPDGDWVYWLILAGRGAGKTRAGAEAVREWIKTFPIVNLVGPTADDVRDVMVPGESGLLACCPNNERPHYYKASAKLKWPNGAISLMFSAEEPHRCAASST
jgi:phage terminase large subunit-like protein